MRDSYLVKANLVDSEKSGELPDRSIKVAIDVEEVKKLIGSITPTPEPEPTRIKISGNYSMYEWIGVFDSGDSRSYRDGNLSFYSPDVVWEKDDGTTLSNLDIYRAMQNGEKFALNFSLVDTMEFIQVPEGASFACYYPPDCDPCDLVMPGATLVSRNSAGEINPNGASEFSTVYGAFVDTKGVSSLTAGFRFHIDDGQEVVEFFATMPGNFDVS